MKKLFKWLLIKVVVGMLVLILSISVVVSLICWFVLWPFVYMVKLISVNVDRNGEFVSKKSWDDWIGGR
jgi:hypothetical protein